MNIREEDFRRTLGLFPTGVAIVTVAHKEGDDIGITISSFTSVSLNPPQVLFCLAKKSKTHEAFKDCSYFAVNILNAQQAHLSDSFASHVPLAWDRFKTHRHKTSGCLLISEALGHVICEKAAFYEGGDHEIILGKVIDLAASPSDFPLIRHQGKYSTSQPISEGDTRLTAYAKS